MKIRYKIGITGLCLVLLASIALFYSHQDAKTTITPQHISKNYLSGNYKIQLKLDPEKPKTGYNQLLLLIHDDKGQPVMNAAIEAYAEMPAMGSMQAMREPVSIESSGAGLYRGRYSLPMNGSWPLTFSISTPKLGKAKLIFDMNTSRTGVKLDQATPSALEPQHQQAVASEQHNTPLNIDQYRRQLIGVKTAEVISQNLTKTIKVNARVNYDQSKLTDITLKYDAWIGQLNADYLGKQIRQGDTLFTVYSPELVSAQDEYLDSLKQQHSFNLRKAARRRLLLWDITPAQIKTLEKRRSAIEYLPISSPVTATVIEKNIVPGSAVKAGNRLIRLADLSTVWVEGEIYESDFPWVKAGIQARIILPEQVESSYIAPVIFIEPVLNPQTHSAIIRVQLDNTSGALRPNMFATMQLQVNLGKRILVPEQAVIYSGAQRIVFVDKGNGRLLPKKIKTGLRNQDMIEVIDGLAPGDKIVTSRNFLIAAESKLKSGLAQW